VSFPPTGIFAPVALMLFSAWGKETSCRRRITMHATPNVSKMLSCQSQDLRVSFKQSKVGSQKILKKQFEAKTDYWKDIRALHEEP
jgi:hypothetical protein